MRKRLIPHTCHECRGTGWACPARPGRPTPVGCGTCNGRGFIEVEERRGPCAGVLLAVAVGLVFWGAVIVAALWWLP